jgi:hypothetical protein
MSPLAASDVSAAAPEPHASSLVTACVLALPGLAPLALTGDPLASCAWLAIAAAPLGVLCAACGLAVWPWSAMVPAAWMAALALACTASTRVLPTPAWAGATWTGLFLAGWALGRSAPRAAWRSSAVCALAALALSALPIGIGLADGAFSPGATARLLDLAPTTWVVESAGVDWLRHPAVYEPARAFDLGPELRAPFRGALAGPSILLVGCALAWTAARRARRRPADA